VTFRTVNDEEKRTMFTAVLVEVLEDAKEVVTVKLSALLTAHQSSGSKERDHSLVNLRSFEDEDQRERLTSGIADVHEAGMFAIAVQLLRNTR